MNRPVHAIVLPPGRRLLAALAAALEGSGPAICPLSPGLPPAALAALLAALRPAAVEDASGVRGRDSALPVASDTALLIATSGSTGEPKIVEQPVHALTAAARAALSRIGAAAGDRWLCCLPTSHIAGLQVLVRSLVAATEPVIHERFDVAATAASGVEHVSVVPTQLRRLLDAGIDLSTFKTILLGGAAAPPGLVAAARARGGRVVTTYGMSETCGGCVYDGLPLDGVSVAVDDEGRIRIAGPVVFSGYRLRPDLTAAARDGRWFVTGDLGRVESGRLLVRGRVDDVINTGGEKVIGSEVAGLLSEHPAVADVVVVGRPDPEWGERVTAVVVPVGAPPTLEELRAWVRSRTHVSAAPRALELVDALPVLPSGKPDLRRARRGARQRRQPSP